MQQQINEQRHDSDNSHDSDIYEEERTIIPAPLNSKDGEFMNNSKKLDYIDTIKLVYITFKSMETKELV